MVSPDFDMGFKQEDLESVAKHEIDHAKQNFETRIAGSSWNTIVNRFGVNTAETLPFNEARSEVVELNANASWRYMRNISWFADGTDPKYPDALKQYTNVYHPLGGGLKDSAKDILQKIYEKIPFIEIKKTGYDWSVRAPQ